MPSSDDVLNFVKGYKQANGGLSPSYDEIADALGLGKTTIRYHLDNLESKGLLTVRGPRSISIPGESYRISEEAA